LPLNPQPIPPRLSSSPPENAKATGTGGGEQDNGPSSTTIIGSVVAAVIFGAILILLVVLIALRRRRRNNILRAHRLEKKPVWEGSTAPPPPPPDSLAFRDHLRLNSETAATSSARDSRSGSDGGEEHPDELPPDLSHSVTSYDAATKYAELGVIKEASSSESSSAVDYQFSYDLAAGLQNTGTGLGALGATRTEDDAEGGCDARRVLQMS